MSKKNAPLIISATNFQSREELDRYILKKIGGDVNKNSESDHKIIGTLDELKKLRLDNNTRIWGIECEYV